MAMSRGGMGKEMAGARLKKRAMGASRQGKKMAAAEMMMPPMAPMAMKKGGMAKKTSEEIMGTGKTAASAKADYAKKMKSAGLKPKFAMGGMAMKPGGMGYKKGGMASKKGGVAVMIILGKGSKKSK